MNPTVPFYPEQYFQRVRVLTRKLSARVDADEACQQVMELLLRRASLLEERTMQKRWRFVKRACQLVVIHLVAENEREEARLEMLSRELPDGVSESIEGSPEEVFEKQVRNTYARRNIPLLPPRQREVVEWMLLGLTGRDIEAQGWMRYDLFRKTLCRALHRLRELEETGRAEESDGRRI